jgi:tetratricopeptide (TPR) repeat protein
LLVFLLLMLAPASALAAPPGKAEFEEAKRLFDRGEPERALPLFEEAYRLSNRRPSTILALALCERELELFARALEHLDEYLEAEPSERETYAELREELRSEVSTIEVKPPPPPPAAAEEPPPPVLTPIPSIVENPGPSALKISLWSAGGAAIATGVVFAVLAARAELDVQDRIENGLEPASAIEDRAAAGFRFAVTADVLLIAGAVAAGLGFFVDYLPSWL